MQGRSAFIVAGLIVVVLGASVSRQVEAATEVCMTAVLVVGKGESVACDYTNAYAYGPVQVVIEQRDNDGHLLFNTSLLTVNALANAQVTSPACTEDFCAVSCRFVVQQTPVAGYSRGAVKRFLDSPDLVALAATCNPF